MSVILKALKSNESEVKKFESESLPEGEGFFKGKQAFIKKMPVSPVSKKRVFILAGILAGLVGVSLTLNWIKNRTAAGNQQEAVSSEQLAGSVQMPVAEQPPPVAATPEIGALVEQAGTAFSAGNLDESLKLFKKAVALDPDDAMLHNNLGLIYVKKELFSSAEDEYKISLEINDKCAECYNNFGYLKALLGEAVEAKKYLDKSLAFASDYPDPHFNLAVLYEKEGDIGNAVKHYRQFSSLFSDKDSEIVVKVNKRIIELAGK